MLLKQPIIDTIIDDENCYTIKRVFDYETNRLSLIQVLNSRGEIYKVLFYDENGRLSGMSIYNPETGREIKGLLYKADGRTISSVRDYDLETEKLISVTFYKADGIGVSSIVEYNDEGTEVQFTLFEEGKKVTTKIF